MMRKLLIAIAWTVFGMGLADLVHLAFAQTITGVPIISAFIKSSVAVSAMNQIGGLGQ